MQPLDARDADLGARAIFQHGDALASTLRDLNILADMTTADGAIMAGCADMSAGGLEC